MAIVLDNGSTNPVLFSTQTVSYLSKSVDYTNYFSFELNQSLS